MMICIYEFIKIIELKSIFPYLLGLTCFFTAVISNNNLVVFEDDFSDKIILSIFLKFEIETEKFDALQLLKGDFGNCRTCVTM